MSRQWHLRTSLTVPNPPRPSTRPSSSSDTENLGMASRCPGAKSWDPASAPAIFWDATAATDARRAAAASQAAVCRATAPAACCAAAAWAAFDTICSEG